MRRRSTIQVECRVTMPHFCRLLNPGIGRKYWLSRGILIRYLGETGVARFFNRWRWLTQNIVALTSPIIISFISPLLTTKRTANRTKEIGIGFSFGLLRKNQEINIIHEFRPKFDETLNFETECFFRYYRHRKTQMRTTTLIIETSMRNRNRRMKPK